MKLYEKISYLRLKSGLSQEETAEHLGVPLETLKEWENNTSMPDVPSICKLSKFFNVTTDYLLCRQRFYKISCWLGLYFPIRFLILNFNLYPSPINSFLLEMYYLFPVCFSLNYYYANYWQAQY